MKNKKKKENRELKIQNELETFQMSPEKEKHYISSLGSIGVNGIDHFDELPEEKREVMKLLRGFMLTVISEVLKSEDYRDVDKMVGFLMLAIKQADIFNKDNNEMVLHHSPLPELPS